MQLEDFHFDLPKKLIAHHALEKRSASRLLCLQEGELRHRHFSDIVSLLNPGDLLVFNDTKVIPARLRGQKTTGGQVECLVERILDHHCIRAQLHVSKRPRVGEYLLFGPDIRLEIIARENIFYTLRYHEDDRSILEVIEAIGEVPLPPYMERLPNAFDKERYQTIYAKHQGSVAAPTAGLHFDAELWQRLRDKNISIGFLTLHIGAGTFAPVRVENILEHQMHAEYLVVSDKLCTQIKTTKAQGGRVVAVGTTSVRALETACSGGEIRSYAGETRIFIYPGYQFQCVDALVTNLHLPRSTLLMLVCAFGGKETVLRGYREAVSNGYRFYSYGDAMWITPTNRCEERAS